MLNWFHNASRSISTLVEETISEEDGNDNSFRSFTLTPLQSHIGILKNKPNPLFHTLPVELKLYIFSFLPPEDLVSSVCCVSKEWKKLASDDRSWEWRFKRELPYWNTYGFHPKYYFIDNINNNTKLEYDVPPISSHVDEQLLLQDRKLMSWKNWYLQQYLHNSKMHHSAGCALGKIVSKGKNTIPKRRGGSRNLSLFSIPLRRSLHTPEREPVFCIPIFGQAMESSASGLLYNLMWAQESPLFVTGLYPGTDGRGSGVGFKVSSKRLNLAAIYGEYPLDISLWGDFINTAHALIYVIDAYISENNLRIAITELLCALEVNPHIPLLVFCCEQQPDEEFVGTDPRIKRFPFEIAENLHIKNETERKWCIQSVTTVTEICKGLEWISSVMI